MRNWGGRAVAACLLAGSGMARAESHSLPPGGERAGEDRLREPAARLPAAILYWLADDGRLHARVEGEPRGKAAAEEWAWKRVQ